MFLLLLVLFYFFLFTCSCMGTNAVIEGFTGKQSATSKSYYTAPKLSAKKQQKLSMIKQQANIDAKRTMRAMMESRRLSSSQKERYTKSMRENYKCTCNGAQIHETCSTMLPRDPAVHSMIHEEPPANTPYYIMPAACASKKENQCCGRSSAV